MRKARSIADGSSPPSIALDFQFRQDSVACGSSARQARSIAAPSSGASISLDFQFH